MPWPNLLYIAATLEVFSSFRPENTVYLLTKLMKNYVIVVFFALPYKNKCISLLGIEVRIRKFLVVIVEEPPLRAMPDLIENKQKT